MIVLLLCLLVESLLVAELAILHEFDPVRIVSLVLHCIVVSLLALCACKDDLLSYSCCHLCSPYYIMVIAYGLLSKTASEKLRLLNLKLEARSPVLRLSSLQSRLINILKAAVNVKRFFAAFCDKIRYISVRGRGLTADFAQTPRERGANYQNVCRFVKEDTRERGANADAVMLNECYLFYINFGMEY